MKTNIKQVLTIVLVAILSATVALFGYDYMQKKNTSSNQSNKAITEFSENFSRFKFS